MSLLVSRLLELYIIISYLSVDHLFAVVLSRFGSEQMRSAQNLCSDVRTESVP